MNIELKPIAQKKLDQMAATVHGVLVKNEAGAWAAVSDAGRVMWLDGFEGRADETRATVIPSEHGKNRYGLDMAYFRELFNRELNRPLVDFRPDELARVLARAARTADAAVLQEPEFQAARAQSGQGVEPVGYTNWAQLAHIKTVGEGAVYSDTDHGCDIALYTHPQPAQQGSVPETKEIIDRVVEELENGFVRCERCGDQEDTATLDCMSDLKRLQSLLTVTHSHNGEQAEEWHAPDEELPPDESTVLALVEDYLEPMVVPARYSENSEQWYDVECVDRDGDQNTLYQVLRWTVMPQPPKSKEGSGDEY